QSSETIDVTSCKSYTSPSGKYVWNSSGQYMDTIRNLVGCDSFLTLNLNILQPSTASISATSCNSYESPSGKIWTVSGIYLDTIPNLQSCDSIVTVNLTVSKKSNFSLLVRICDRYLSPSGKYLWTASG